MVVPELDFPAAMVSERLLVTGGIAKFLIGVKRVPGTGGLSIGMKIIDSFPTVAINEIRIGITCAPFVANDKSVMGLSIAHGITGEVKFADYSSLPQWMINFYGLVSTPNPNFMSLFSFISAGVPTDAVFFMENHNPLFKLSNGLWNQLGGKTVIFKVITDDIYNHPYAGHDPFLDQLDIPVTCATQQNGKILGLGGPCPPPNNSKRWSLSADRVISLILSGRFKFVLPSPGGPITIQIKLPFGGSIPVIITPSEEVVVDAPWPGLTPFLKAKSDGNVPTKLLQLPSCPP